jgi:hypothetical protein
LPIQPEAKYDEEYSKYFIHQKIGHESYGERLMRLATLDMLDASMSVIRKFFRKHTGVIKMETAENGYTVWAQHEKEIAEGTYNLQEQLDLKVMKYPESSLAFSKFTGLSEVRKQYWEDIIDICRENHIKVYAFLPPVHPQLYCLFQAEGIDKLLAKISEYLESTLGEIDGVFRDYTSIDSFGGNPDDFYDEIHMRPQNCELLIRHLIGDSEGGDDGADMQDPYSMHPTHVGDMSD